MTQIQQTVMYNKRKKVNVAKCLKTMLDKAEAKKIIFHQSFKWGGPDKLP